MMIPLEDVVHRTRLGWDNIDAELTRRFFQRNPEARIRGDYRLLDRMRRGVTRRCGIDLVKARAGYDGSHYSSWPLRAFTTFVKVANHG